MFRLVLVVLFGCLVGCGYKPVFEYRVIEETETGYMSHSGDEMPRVEDDYVYVRDGNHLRILKVEDVEFREIQIGPHECECGAILRTYRDRCSECGVMILMGCRTPPGDEVE